MSAPAPAAADAAPKTVALTLTGIFEDVPGESKDKIKRAKENETLWLDPLTMLSNFPVQKRSTVSYGVVAGGGQKTVDTFSAPVVEGPPQSGRGSITAALKYAGDTSKSFSVTLSGLKTGNKPSAEEMARKIVEREIKSFGDVDEITATAEKELNAVEKYQGAKVSISVRDSKVMDAGRTTFYYKVRSNAGIQMDMQVAAIGEKQTKYSGSTTKGSSTEKEAGSKKKSSVESDDISKKESDTYKKKETSTEIQDVDYIESATSRLNDGEFARRDALNDSAPHAHQFRHDVESRCACKQNCDFTGHPRSGRVGYARHWCKNSPRRSGSCRNGWVCQRKAHPEGHDIHQRLVVVDIRVGHFLRGYPVRRQNHKRTRCNTEAALHRCTHAHLHRHAITSAKLW